MDPARARPESRMATNRRGQSGVTSQAITQLAGGVLRLLGGSGRVEPDPRDRGLGGRKEVPRRMVPYRLQNFKNI